MARVAIAMKVHAAPERVFDLFCDIPQAANRIRGITRIEMLTEGPVAVGTRWRETRVMFGKEATEEMVMTQFEPGRSYTVEADSCGAHWMTVFRFLPDGADTEVTCEMEIRPISLLARIMSPLSGMMTASLRKCIQQDCDDLKAALETESTTQPA